jgi:hypothetical protein
MAVDLRSLHARTDHPAHPRPLDDPAQLAALDLGFADVHPKVFPAFNVVTA